MELLQFPHSAYLVTKAPVSIWDATSPTAPTQAGTWPSGRTCRCKVTISSVSGHTDCAGTLTVGAETLTFTQAGTKTTTSNLTASPIILSSGMDCHVRIIVLDTGGADIQAETLTPIKILYEYVESGFFLPSGVWTTYSGSYALVCNSTIDKNDIIRYNGDDLIVKKIEPLEIFGNELYRILYF